MKKSVTKAKKNEPRIEFTPRFEKQRKEVSVGVKRAFREALALFLENPNHTKLRNHPLKKRLSGYKSIDVTADYRALFKIKQTTTQMTITFHMIGAHEELYGTWGEK